MSSHAPASLPCNGFTLPYNPFTPQCTEYPFCCLSLWPTAPSQPSTPTHHPNPLPTPTHPSLYPFRSVSMSLKEKEEGGVMCFSAASLVWCGEAISLPRRTCYVGLCLGELHTEPFALLTEAELGYKVIPAFDLRVWAPLNGNMCKLCKT